MLKRLYDIIFRFQEYFLYGLLVSTCVYFLSLNDSTQIRSIRSAAVVSVGYLQEMFGFIPNYFNLRQENKVLRELNLSLADEVSRLREARLENLRLRGLLTLKGNPPQQYRSANVVGKTLQLLRNTITLDVGEVEGVRANMPILTEHGLVGKILVSGRSYSIGQILLNRDIRVSAKDQRSRVDGIIQWEGGRGLALQSVAKTLDVQSGDVIITSEYSSLFPPGIKIGTVVHAQQTPGLLFQTIDVEPSVDFSSFEEVFVILAAPDSARLAVDRRAREYAGQR